MVKNIYICSMIYKSSKSDIITDVDVKGRIVKGYFNIFGNIDSDNDMIMPGSYKKTISENPRIKHLYQHNPTFPLSSVRSGKLKVYEDAKGLVFESEISDTSWGRDVLKLYEDEVIDEHSVGIRVTKSSKRSGYREITEVMMMEGSTVTWGANEEARLVGIKSENLIKSLRTRDFENQEIIDLFEIYFAQSEPEQKASTPLPSNQIDTWASAINQFIHNQ